MSNATVANLMRGHIETLAAQGKRTDGRGTNEFRGVSIETGLISTAEGSSRVSLGDTTVMCGVKLLVGTPYPDSPGRGSMTTTAELA
ncbi:MAG: RNA-binding protein, partial [Candidatus Thermoplasmatota archaeon]|nr:RNA-binding protein [Candidatus Thermoplasmatota archaeon]